MDIKLQVGILVLFFLLLIGISYLKGYLSQGE